MDKKQIKKFIILITVLLLVGALLVFVVYSNTDENGKVLQIGDAESESLYLLVICLLLVPILLAGLILALVLSKLSSAEAPEAAEEPSERKKEEKKEESEQTERFCMLSAIDRKKNTYGHSTYEANVSLEGICENFRNYAATKLKLYYDIEDIRKFISGMAVSRLLILQGMSGTGKTSLAHAYGSFTDNPSTVIPVQPMWKERTDLIGYYNEFTKRFNETLLLEKMYEANYSKDMYVTVLDEMNIARIEYYFAEFLSLLELPNPDERF
ncbi:MAG: AAA family ATPase, partial [Clostridia bacterium]|nr:AAA family ATPase [Clostridia bacterium]